MHRTPHLLALAATVLAAAPAVAQGGGPRVAIAAAAANDPSDCRFVDLQLALQATQRFAAVDLLDVVTTTPPLTAFNAYDAVITWSNVSYHSGSDLGDRLADYVDGGGGVVVSGWALMNTTTDQHLGGRWITGGYEVILHTSGLQTGAASLGSVLLPQHPLAFGVQDMSATIAPRPFLMAQWGLAAGGRVVLEWNDGRMMAAVSDQRPGRVDLGVHPVGSGCQSGFLPPTSDAVTLIANALEYTATGGSIGTSYCDSTANSTGVPARLFLNGSDVAADNALRLDASSLPSQTFGYFLCSRHQGFFASPGGSQGNLCLGAPVGRFLQQVQSSGSSGRISITADLTALPTPSGPVVAVAGETWNFQAWFRDANPTLTSNLTNGSSLLLR